MTSERDAQAEQRRHVRVGTITPEDRRAAVAAMKDAEADWIEVRLDALWPSPPSAEAAGEDLATILEAAPAPVLATLRPMRQGGRFNGPETVRVNLLLAAAQAGCHVDLEDDNEQIGAVLAPFREAGNEVVLSDHRFQETPSREVGLRHLQSMQDQHVAYDKVAFPCGSFMDALRALELAHGHAHRAGRPCIAPVGGSAMLRALLPLAGNHATYGHLDQPAVPGQPGLADIQAHWDHWGLDNAELPGDPEAGWYCVIGQPVDHSLSPRIHNAMFRHAGRAARFGALEVPDSIGAVRLLTGVSHRIGLRGCSVTMPLKHHAFQVCGPDEIATATGAVNCLRFTQAGVEGTNTDATAMRRLLDGVSSVVVLGAGGAARAAIAAAQDLGHDVTFTNRDAARAAAVREATGADWVHWDEREGLRGDAWVQATPLTEGTDLPGVADARVAIELVYGKGPTAFEQAHGDAIDGRAFLIEQAVDAYRYWTGEEADRKVMEAAL